MAKMLWRFWPVDPNYTFAGLPVKRPIKSNTVGGFRVKFYQIWAIPGGTNVSDQTEDEWPGWYHGNERQIVVFTTPELYRQVCWAIAHTGRPKDFDGKMFPKPEAIANIH